MSFAEFIMHRRATDASKDIFSILNFLQSHAQRSENHLIKDFTKNLPTYYHLGPNSTSTLAQSQKNDLSETGIEIYSTTIKKKKNKN